MKRLMTVIVWSVLLLACHAALSEAAQYPDGVYRGFYYEGGIEQVAVQFELKDGRFRSVVLRGLKYEDGDYMTESASEEQKAALAQYRALAEHLVGRDVSAIAELYAPQEILAGVVSGASVSPSPLISALWDGLNRRPYKYVDTSKLPEAMPYPDGAYRGVYEEGGGEEVVLEFTVKDNCITQIAYRTLQYKGEDYLSPGAADAVQKMAGQFQELIHYLVGKPIAAVNDLYQPGDIASDTDVSTAATLRAPKVISAIWDGLNKNAYQVD